MYDLVVVGAGPYGLSIAAHAAAAGLRLRVFGRPMASWRDHMPPGMFLKSEPWASHLSDPAGRFGLDTYCAGEGIDARHGTPVPVPVFAAYGLWFARHAVPCGVDERLVSRVQPLPGGGFRVTAEDGENLLSRTVALAVGVMPFTDLPPVLAPLRAAGLVSHSSDHDDLSRFAGGDVTVVGGGQAALETAALLAEQGTRARVLVRAPGLCWNTLPPPWQRPWWQSARAPHSGLGSGWRNWFYSELPGVYRRLPADYRSRVARAALGPAGAWWVRERVTRGVEVVLGREVRHAAPSGTGLRLAVSGARGEVLYTDHVIAATGFTPAANRLTVLDAGTRAALRTAALDGSPEVDAGFESSLPGLFMAGLVTAASYGPSMRFVLGADYTASRLVKGVRARLRGTPRPTPPPAPLPHPTTERRQFLRR
ncbi:FAD-dependent oxidoreductase [Streptomyces sp. SID11385]|uniref:FAD-dependent oxidoreductase n=1 Tax=Streptomyces sp. SID11385 TaxID=2706031 RepID=UPI001945830D|nr:FAD-dependent oxidoreductase [Streptomyces sp. SID11385]